MSAAVGRSSTPNHDDPGEASDEVMGDPVGYGGSDDSSEEMEDDEEEARRVREGFIVDEEEEESGEEADKHRKRRKRRKRNREEEDVLEEDDLDLLEENTGRRVDRQRLTRIRRIRDSESPSQGVPSFPGASRQRDQERVGLDGGIDDIWEDEDRQAGEPLDDESMVDFIDDDDQDEGMAQEEREERRREKKRLERERHRAMGARPELTGIDTAAWDEIYQVFGDGTDYDWALDDDSIRHNEDLLRPDIKFSDVFEPSEIKARLLSEEDDVIRMQDIPERMQLTNSMLSPSSGSSALGQFPESELYSAAHWITLRLSERHEKDYFRPDGQFHDLLPELINAVQKAIRYMFLDRFEVTYIWAHKRDYITHFDAEHPTFRVEYLRRDDLWRIYNLGRKYQAFLERRAGLKASFDRLQVQDDYFTNTIMEELDTVESVSDATDWLGLKYRNHRKDDVVFQFHDDDVDPSQKRRKLPNKLSNYEIVKNSLIGKLASEFGLKAHEIVLNHRAVDNSTKLFFVEDPELPPIEYAEQFGDPNQSVNPEDLLQQARLLIATELGKDPLLRKNIRELFKNEGMITVVPTDKGIIKIDDFHPYNQFKYLKQKPVKWLLDVAQFLHILAAEAEHLVTVSVELPAASLHNLEAGLVTAFESDSFSDSAKAWNEQRKLVIKEAIDKFLIPSGIKWVREWVRDEAQTNLAKRCGIALRERINTKGYAAQPGERYARVIAASWGKGDPQKDAITLVYLDENGVLRDNIKVDNLFDDENKDTVKDLVARRGPGVIVIGGLSIHTTKLVAKFKELFKADTGGTTTVPIIYGFDDVARLYQHSKRAEEEFTALSPIAKYCVGLARYTQSPLNEYVALGEDIFALTFDDETQNLIPKDKFLYQMEQVIVDVVNDLGVDINRAVTDPYYRHLLPFVCGLGPRKAQALAKKIASLGGNVINRQQFVRGEIITTRIFENCSAFLRIPQNQEARPEKTRGIEDSELPDPLDDTRIHPEDYELARKMAADALDLDEEDVQDEHPSYVVNQIMQAADGAKRLDELNLDDFAVNMFRSNGDLKRHTLNTIREELLKPYSDRRKAFTVPTAEEVLTMLTSETSNTLRVGLIVSVIITRFSKNYAVVRLDSGMEGVINTQYIADVPPDTPDQVAKKGQTLQGVIIDVKNDMANDSFGVELSSRPRDIAAGDASFRKVAVDESFYDQTQAMKDQEMLQRRKRNEAKEARRVIKHPNFHNFTSSQAEAYLSHQQRGDVVVRPSSKGMDHLAVTWKVDDGVYQHIDVVEPNADLTKQSVGGRLILDNGKYEFADLDELIVNHVQALARRVEELMDHEKFKKGSDDQIRKELDDYLQANPSKSIYCFTLNRKRPGHFNLVFKATPSSPTQTWPVRVAPEAFYLFDTVAPSVPELCDAFKFRHLHQSNLGTGPGGSKTPYGGRTPGHMTPGFRTPGHRTPGQPQASRRTPNPYTGIPGYNGDANAGGNRRPAMVYTSGSGGWGGAQGPW